MHQFPKFTPAWNSICFGEFLCPSSGVYSLYTRHWYMSYRFEDSFRAGPGWNCVPEELPETCRVSCRSKFRKLVHMVGFIIKKTDTIWCYIVSNGRFTVGGLVWVIVPVFECIERWKPPKKLRIAEYRDETWSRDLLNMTQEYFDVFRYQEMWLSGVWRKYLIYGLLFVCFPGVTTNCGCIFTAP